MGITAVALKCIKKFTPCNSLLSLSYPDMVMSQEELQNIVGFKTERETDFGRWHGRPHKLPDTDEVFTKLGINTIKYIDIVSSRGKEEIANLNEPQSLGKYDIVLDCGTTEHCANIWQATVNAATAVKPGGIIIHTPPLTMLNHGFYCPQPTFYFDLYTQNGWNIEEMSIVKGTTCTTSFTTERFQTALECSLFIVARKIYDGIIKYPTQSKYLNNPGLK